LKEISLASFDNLRRHLFILCVSLLVFSLFFASVPASSQSPSPTATMTPTNLPMSDGLQLKLGQTVEGNIAQRGQRDRLIIFGAAGTILSLGMYTPIDSRLVPHIEIYAPNGEVVVSTTHPTGAVIIGYQLPVTGAYIVFASADGNRTRGAYTITLTAGNAVRDLPRGSLTLDATVRDGNLTRAGDRDIYDVDLPANVTLSANIVPYQSALVPVVEIVDTEGNVVARATGTSGLRQVVLTPAIGTQGRYQVRIGGTLAQATGGYLISVRVLTPSSTPNN
jgi:hypothetical protein